MSTTLMAGRTNSQENFFSSSSRSSSTRKQSHYFDDHEKENNPTSTDDDHHKVIKRKLQAVAVSRLRSALTAFRHRRGISHGRLGHKVVGTLFGYRRGHVNFVLQREHNTSPVFFIELATPITALVKEMASGLVRIALECDKQEEIKVVKGSGSSVKLMEEPVWRTYCNGKQCGYATKRELGPKEVKILKTVEPISMGAGLLPGFNGAGAGPDGELMYMRAKFERVVGSRDSEAFYMMNPDYNGAPELSIYLLRV